MQASRFLFILALAATQAFAVRPLAAAEPRTQAQTQTLAGAAQARQKALADLLGRLRQAPDAQAAAPVRAIIVRLWGHSGSPTADLLMTRAESLLQAGDGATAAALLDRVVTLYPDWTLGWRRRAQSALLQGDSEGAMLDLDHALGVEPNDFMAMTELAALMRAEGRNAPALELLRRALAIDPQNDPLRQEADQLERQIEGNRI
jgi:tetratricopeptide (TPR) repeat protein